MKGLFLLGAMVASTVILAALPLLADTQIWPWKDKTPPDPALVVLPTIDDVTVAIKESEPPVVVISVKATAPTPGFTELRLVPRIGDPKDLIFAFDAKGRPPQDMTAQVVSPVSFSTEYSDAPVDSLGVVEVYGQENCKAFAVKELRATDCTSASLRQ